jgi:hypothetical protein
VKFSTGKLKGQKSGSWKGEKDGDKIYNAIDIFGNATIFLGLRCSVYMQK